MASQIEQALAHLPKGSLASDHLLQLHDASLDSINDVDKVAISLTVLLDRRRADDAFQTSHTTAAHDNTVDLTLIEKLLSCFFELFSDLLWWNSVKITSCEARREDASELAVDSALFLTEKLLDTIRQVVLPKLSSCDNAPFSAILLCGREGKGCENTCFKDTGDSKMTVPSQLGDQTVDAEARY
ncbi:hypothetical protein SNK03_007342 [Fusarium graminearum]